MSQLTVNDRQSIIDDLINNTDWSEDDRETLEGLNDQQLQRIVANAVIADDVLTANEEEEEEEEFDTDDGGDPGDEDDDDDDDEDELTSNKKKVPVHNAFPPNMKKKKKKEESMEKETTCNSAEEYLNRAPASVRESLRDILESAKAEKRQLIKSLTSNASCPWDKAELASMENSTLRKLAKLAGINGRGPVYNGANAGEFSLTDNELIEEKPIPRASLDFSKTA